MALHVGRDFQTRWLAAPAAVRQQVFSELHSICQLLEMQTDFDQWQINDAQRDQQQQALVKAALEEQRLAEAQRQRAEQLAREQAAAEEKQRQEQLARDQAEAERIRLQQQAEQEQRDIAQREQERLAQEQLARQQAEHKQRAQQAAKHAAEQAELHRLEQEQQALEQQCIAEHQAAKIAQQHDQQRNQQRNQQQAAQALQQQNHDVQALTDALWLEAEIYIEETLQQLQERLKQQARIEIEQLVSAYSTKASPNT